MLWLLGIGGGMLALVRHQSTPGMEASAPAQWPREARLARDLRQPALLVFAHPQCPCTHATIRQLNRLLAKCGGRLNVHVFFLQPAEVNHAWAESDSWRSASSIPGVQVHRDPLGEQARLFGAATSGRALLYGQDGRLLFCGGITAGRGHDGDNAGAEAIIRFVNEGSRTEAVAATPVFGCPLFNGGDINSICAK